MIVIPMAGLSRRFILAGYDRPKYMLEAGGKTLFWHSVHSFKEYFGSTPFLFIYRDVNDTDCFVRKECEDMGIKDAHFASLGAPTGGQAETVYLGLQTINPPGSEPLTIFNIDTIRPGFSFPVDPTITHADGYLEVFRGKGSNWSFVRAEREDATNVIATTEKRPVSDLCCTGLYHFAAASDFISAYVNEIKAGPSQAGEYFIAPLYNYLIQKRKDIRYYLIDRKDVIFSGVPEEYDDFRRLCGDI